jgi:hypothetical protein
VIERIEIVALIVSVVLLIVVLELVRRRKLTEEYSFLWILSSLLLLAVSVRREILHAVARWLGVYYPPIVLVMLLIVMVFVASLCFSVIVSRQRQQIERLIEETAILSAELRDLRAQMGSRPDVGTDLRVRPEAAGDVVARAARDRAEPGGQ